MFSIILMITRRHTNTITLLGLVGTGLFGCQRLSPSYEEQSVKGTIFDEKYNEARFRGLSGTLPAKYTLALRTDDGKAFVVSTHKNAEEYDTLFNQGDKIKITARILKGSVSPFQDEAIVNADSLYPEFSLTRLRE